MIHRAHQGVGRFRYKAGKSSGEMCGRRHVSLYDSENGLEGKSSDTAQR
jgi:hypothetical protein